MKLNEFCIKDAKGRICLGEKVITVQKIEQNIEVGATEVVGYLNILDGEKVETITILEDHLQGYEINDLLELAKDEDAQVFLDVKSASDFIAEKLDEINYGDGNV